MNLFEGKQAGPVRIADFVVHRPVDGIFKVIEVSRKKKNDGAAFLVLTLTDPTGRISAKVWDQVEAAGQILRPGAICHVGGEVGEYQGRKDLKIVRFRTAAAGDPGFDPADFVERPTFDTEKTYRELLDFLRSLLVRPHLRQLLDCFDERHGAVFSRHYGAQKVHHAYLGGLLKHTDALVRLAAVVAEYYGLDREILCLGAFLHDIGKTVEFTIEPAPDLSPSGGLLGHIMLGCQMVQEMKATIPDFPEADALALLHLLVSHHGQKELGSPEPPKTPEAMALHCLDLLDSRLEIFRAVAAPPPHPQPRPRFAEYNPYLGVRVYLSAPPCEPET